MVYLAAYFVLGIFVSAFVALVGRVRGEKDFTPISMSVLLGNDAISLLAGLILWPLWIAIQIIEWSWPSEPCVPVTSGPPAVILPGMVGRAVSDLKPGGKVHVGASIVDAITDSTFIESGQEVEVLEPMPTGVRVRLKMVDPRPAPKGRPAP